MRRVLFLLMGAFPLGAAAQRVPTASLGPPTATLDEEFSFVLSMRELGDGRVLIVDTREQRLVVADLSSGLVEQIGRRGRGPNEYESLTWMYPLAGDSTLIPTWNRRWLLLHGARIVATMRPDSPVITASAGVIRGADERGVVLDLREPPQRSGVREFGKGDSLFIVLVDRKTARIDTVSKVRDRPRTTESEVDSDGRVTRMSTRHSPPYSVGEDALLFSDGWLAVSRLDPYRVDWRSADGKWIRGAPIGVPTVKVDRREKRGFMERLAKRWNRTRVGNPDVQTGWPEVVPPFQSFALQATGGGQLVIERTPTVAYPGTRYDVVDRRGALVVQLVLPESQQVIGFGRESVYVLETDDDGIQRLRRHAWPVRK